MNLLLLNQLGAREQKNPAGEGTGVVDFGVLLPGITPADGSLFVKIIHEDDQFIQDVPPLEFPLAHSQLDGVDYWSGTVDIPHTPGPATSANWGQKNEARYVYRYCLKRVGASDIDNIIDPFAREFGVGSLSAITLGYQPFVFDAAVEAAFKIPVINDAIVYEVNIAELGGDLEESTNLLGYIADLGFNVIEVMPVSNVVARIDWGYAPLGYFGVDERFGKRRDFQAFVAEAHRLGMAVVLDVVYGHVSAQIAYEYLYSELHKASPFTGPYAADGFKPSTDFAKSLTQDFYYTANLHWLEVFRVDGFRYDAAQDFWDESRPSGDRGFVDLAEASYNYVLSKRADQDFSRFFPAPAADPTLIQIAEFLDDPPHLLSATVSNSVWQDSTMSAAKSCARGENGAIAGFGLCLGLNNYPVTATTGGITVAKSALQYIENHDHERFICSFGTHFPSDHSQDELLKVGDRDDKWFKVQPYLIGLLTAKGTPLFWQGQEICEDYYVPPYGDSKDFARTTIFRPIDFNKFYDTPGKALVGLTRKLTAIRKAGKQFTAGDHFFYNDPAYNDKGLLVFHRSIAGGKFSLVALNFTGSEQSFYFKFPVSGSYTELIEGGPRNLPAVVAGTDVNLTVPSNYGCIWTN